MRRTAVAALVVVLTMPTLAHAQGFWRKVFGLPPKAQEAASKVTRASVSLRPASSARPASSNGSRLSSSSSRTSSHASSTKSNLGSIGVNTSGHATIGLGNGLTIDSTNGHVGIQLGGTPMSYTF